MRECAVCAKEIKPLEKFNGEQMCEECYNDPENYVFGDEAESVIDD